jgi:hypothetical protein
VGREGGNHSKVTSEVTMARDYKKSERSDRVAPITMLGISTLKVECRNDYKKGHEDGHERAEQKCAYEVPYNPLFKRRDPEGYDKD